MLKKTIENGSGKVLQITEYKYDKNHNPIEEKVGDGTDWRIIYRTFSDDGFNLKLTESDHPSRVIHYTYLPAWKTVYKSVNRQFSWIPPDVK